MTLLLHLTLWILLPIYHSFSHSYLCFCFVDREGAPSVSHLRRTAGSIHIHLCISPEGVKHTACGLKLGLHGVTSGLQDDTAVKNDKENKLSNEANSWFAVYCAECKQHKSCLYCTFPPFEHFTLLITYTHNNRGSCYARCSIIYCELFGVQKLSERHCGHC